MARLSEDAVRGVVQPQTSLQARESATLPRWQNDSLSYADAIRPYLEPLWQIDVAGLYTSLPPDPRLMVPRWLVQRIEELAEQGDPMAVALVNEGRMKPWE